MPSFKCWNVSSCRITVGKKNDFPESWELPDLMDDFVNGFNPGWAESDALELATDAFWRLNRIHPFINGNGRTARATCLFVLCLKAGGWINFSPILPELIRENRNDYVEILRSTDETESNGKLNIQPLIDFLAKLTSWQN